MNGRFVLKLTAWIVALTLVALPVVGVLNGWFAVDRWPVRALQVEAEYNHVSAEQIRAAAATHLGTGFFALKLEEVRAAVAALPWVESVEVRKRWPDTLELRVRERQPFARWGDRRLIGRDGALFTAPGGDSIQGLPQLDGPDDELVEVVDFFAKTQRALTGSGLILSGASLNERGSWKLTLTTGAEIMLGHEQVDARVQRFLAVLPRLSAEHGGVFQRADLRYSNGFSILWASAPATPPASGTPVSDKPLSDETPGAATAAEAHT
jgi:cell division protein FtsQ